MGRAKKEGWVRKVLGIFECQVETRAMMRPGNRTTAKVRKNVRRGPPYGRILQGPVFKALAKPKLAAKRDVM